MIEYVITDKAGEKLGVTWTGGTFICCWRYHSAPEVAISLTPDQAKELAAIIMAQVKEIE